MLLIQPRYSNAIVRHNICVQLNVVGAKRAETCVYCIHFFFFFLLPSFSLFFLSVRLCRRHFPPVCCLFGSALRVIFTFAVSRYASVLTHRRKNDLCENCVTLNRVLPIWNLNSTTYLNKLSLNCKSPASEEWKQLTWKSVLRLRYNVKVRMNVVMEFWSFEVVFERNFVTN